MFVVFGGGGGGGVASDAEEKGLAAAPLLSTGTPRAAVVGADVARSPGRGGSASALEQPVLKIYSKSDVAVKIQRHVIIIIA